MKTACFIPIKKKSMRVESKNLRELNGKPLFAYVLDTISTANCFDEIYVDTDSELVCDYALSKGILCIKREEHLLKDSANGNDLLNYHLEKFPQFNLYFQVFVTSPFLSKETIIACRNKLVENNEYDSCFTAIEKRGFFWKDDIPINYIPNILPRSQDLPPIFEETTGLYGIKKEALEKYRCRIGKKPFMYIVPSVEAIDINYEEDWKMAEIISKHIINISNSK